MTEAAKSRLGVLRDGLVNHAGILIASACGIVSVPLALRGMGSALYPLWIANLALVTLILNVDLGLNAAVTRLLAKSLDDEASRSLGTLASTSLLVAVGQVAVVAAVASAMPAERTFSSFVTLPVLAAAVLIGQHAQDFGRSALFGRGKFAQAAFVLVFAAGLKLGGYAFLVFRQREGMTLVLWDAFVALATGCLAIVQALRHASRIRWSFDRVLLRANIGFFAGSQLIGVGSGLVRSGPILLLSVVSGPGAVTLYSIGQRFPSALSGVAGALSQALYPRAAASNIDGAQRAALVSDGLRWMLLLALPAVLWLEVMAQPLLRLWIPSVGSAAVTTMRWLTLAALLDGGIYSITNVLWGAGYTRSALQAMAAMAAIIVCGAILGGRVGGASQLAAIVFIAGVVGASLMVYALVTTFEVKPAPWFRQVVSGYGWPSLACLAAAGLLATPARASWIWLTLSAPVCGAIFLGIARLTQRGNP